MRLVLASASPRRHALLADAGFVFDVAAAKADERRHPDESPAQYVERIALEKARLIAAAHPDAVVLGADTEVVLDGTVFGKPADRADAARMLKLLSGRAHDVLTAFAIVGGGREFATVVGARVWFRPLGDPEILTYVATAEPFDKAGAYAIQGRASAFVERVEGAEATVVGLPVGEVVEALQRFGVTPDRSTRGQGIPG
jgi:septum formation protein